MSVMAQVERGQVSLGLVGRKTDSPNLQFRFLTSDRMVLVVPPGHALSRRKQAGVAPAGPVVPELSRKSPHPMKPFLLVAGTAALLPFLSLPVDLHTPPKLFKEDPAFLDRPADPR